MYEDEIMKAFESIGIPKMQTTVYLDLLKNRDSTATQISQRTKMHRANVYDTLSKLIARNIVFLTNKDGKKVFTALSTDLILHSEREKLDTLKNVMGYITTAYVPGQTPKVYTLEGSRVVKVILFSLLEKNQDIWVYGLAENDTLTSLLNHRLMHSFHMERIKRHIELKLLFSKFSEEEQKNLSKIKNTEARLLPASESRVSQITQIVCGNCVYITLWVHPFHTIVIENDVIAKEYRDFYSMLWGYAGKEKSPLIQKNQSMQKKVLA